MSRRLAPLRSWLAFVALLTLVLPACANVRVKLDPAAPVPAGDALQVGLARTEISAIPGYPMGGHSIGGRTAWGAWGRLHARAVWIDDGERGVALVAVDLWAVSHGLRDAVVERLQARGLHHIGRHDVILGASHTHHSPAGFDVAPALNLAGGHRPVYDPRLFDHLADRIADAIEQAFSQREPATIIFGLHAAAGVARNRSLEPFVQNPEAPEVLADNILGPDHCVRPYEFSPARLACEAVDPRVRVLRFVRRSDGSLIGAAAFVAVHATAMPNTTEAQHGDIFALAATRIERRLQAGASAASGTHASGRDVRASISRGGPTAGDGGHRKTPPGEAGAGDDKLRTDGGSDEPGERDDKDADPTGPTDDEPPGQDDGQDDDRHEGAAAANAGDPKETAPQETSPEKPSDDAGPASAGGAAPVPPIAPAPIGVDDVEGDDARPPIVVALFNGPEGDVSPAWDVQDRASAERVASALVTGIDAALAAPPSGEPHAYVRAVGGIVRLDDQRVVDADGIEHRTGKRAHVGKTALPGAEDGVTSFVASHREGDRRRWPRGREGYKRKSGISMGEWLMPPIASLEVFSLGGPGGVVVVSVPGEFSTTMGWRIRRAVAESAHVDPDAVMVVGLANGYRGYFITPNEYDLQHYEGGQTYWGAWAGMLVSERLKCMSAAISIAADGPRRAAVAACGARQEDGEIVHRPGLVKHAGIGARHPSAARLARAQCHALVDWTARSPDAAILIAPSGGAAMRPWSPRAHEPRCPAKRAERPRALSWEVELPRSQWPSANGADVLPEIWLEEETGACRFSPLRGEEGEVRSSDHAVLLMLSRTRRRAWTWWAAWLGPHTTQPSGRVRWHAKLGETERCSPVTVFDEEGPTVRDAGDCRCDAPELALIGSQ